MSKVYVALASCITIFFISCFKAPKGFDPPTQIVTSDTLTTGNYWGIAVGDNHTTVYSKTQSLREEKSINTISVVNNIFTSLAAIKDKLPLYHSLFLDASTASANGVQIFFENDKVKSIYTNAGQLLNNWPWNTAPSQSIYQQDAVNSLYDKLVTIKSMPSYDVYFQRLSLFHKNTKTAYDADMSSSPKWILTSPLSEKVFLRVNLTFNAGSVVDSIMVDRIETL